MRRSTASKCTGEFVPAVQFVTLAEEPIGTASDAAIAMELGYDGILMNTAIAEAEDAEQMAVAMKLATQAGRLAFLAGRMTKRLYASASSPLAGVVR